MSASVRAGTLVVERLLAAGVRSLVLSPGSRSAPVALAAAAAERAGALGLLVRVDERSAGFTALGVAKVTGAPVAIVCTSGTAVANLLPAVVEARYSGVPLVVVTADRPPELRGRGASQTIAQAGLFDGFVLGSRDLPVPADDRPDGPDRTAAGGASGPGAADLSVLQAGGPWETVWQRHVDAAVALAARARGPVHLNTPFRPPLVGAVDSPLRTGPAPDLPRAVRTDAGPLPARGVIVAGDLDVWADDTRSAVIDLADACGWPIVAEASSGLLGCGPTVPHGTLLLSDPAVRQRLRAEVVVTIGPFGLDRGVLQYVREAGRHLAVRSRPRTDPPDPLRTAERILDGVPTRDRGPVDEGWLSAWQEESHAFAPRVDAALAAHGPTVGTVARDVWVALGRDDLLVTASSLAIRALAGFTSGPGPRVLANRGANGIDGLVSTAWGAAAAWQQGPVWRGGGQEGAGTSGTARHRTVALLGDLAFLHDHNGLLAAASEDPPNLTIVVADNDGGAIFRTLEQGAEEFAADYDRVFGTPHRLDLVAVAEAAGLPAHRVDLAGLAAALRDEQPGVRVLVVPVGEPARERSLLELLRQQEPDGDRPADSAC